MEIKPRPVNIQNMGIIAIAVFILAVIFWWIFTPSEIVEYRVKLGPRGIYRVEATVKYGLAFDSFQAIDGNEALRICNELNQELMKDRGMARAARAEFRR